MRMRGHSEIMYLEMIAMALGALLFISGDTLTGLILFGVGAAVHFGMGGFGTGF